MSSFPAGVMVSSRNYILLKMQSIFVTDKKTEIGGVTLDQWFPNTIHYIKFNISVKKPKGGVIL